MLLSATFARRIATHTTAPSLLRTIMTHPMPASDVVFRVKRLSPQGHLPMRASKGAAGYDLFSARDMVIPARSRALVPTDISLALPEGTYGRMAPRSSLALRHGIDVGAGVIDCDYRGPLGVMLFNHSDEDFQVVAGNRIAQLIIETIITPPVVEVDDLDDTERGAGAFGSTGA
ncbi:dUTP pyrophosphatase [Fonticula alba]|uniref:Deoxyuridine 5'-triphosphate nucleotidohydrolase n=1 Tax=Fonticula alba TaxID=691883 RepID=A0A058Z086_FONAL|nr:dUTP pyrophosphatase [Fonticula alba]KCV67665.1 dUTP pyrophosphatase [Fonticula alba]|eukprot:XP_009497849.1 dUTP pyrophosphatase [Fonticula alba]